MAKVLLGMNVSLDGFINDRNGSVDRLYPDLEALRKTELLQETIGTTGAVVIGGADTAQQCLRAGLVDELEIGIVRVVFGEGLRLFEHLDTVKIELERSWVIEAAGATVLRFRVIREN